MKSKSVYPRPRGGTHYRAELGGRDCGLSPPTRGNPSPTPYIRRTKRSIPAHAGEPNAQSPPPGGDWVYPRPRGGTSRKAFALFALRGLSPPTRGNHPPPPSNPPPSRSIPAHAGEPSGGLGVSRAAGVYPRPRGGTRVGGGFGRVGGGLSPPTRGNRARPTGRALTLGSIPAHAGEPRLQTSQTL